MLSYRTYLHKLEQETQQFLKTIEHKPEFLYSMLQYHMGWMDQNFTHIQGQGGKRIRPLLLLLCCEALCSEWHHAVPSAIAVELLHNFTLIHDDIEDRDVVRRGRPTLWSIWGIPQAINAGDALYALAFKALLHMPLDIFDNLQIVHAAKVYTDTVLRITEGQCQDISFESSQIVSDSDYLDMIAGKTASLFGLSCELGALCANADDGIEQTMRDFGYALGMAFQMQDDILGLWGDPQNTGKPVGSDLMKAKKTLPILHCAQNSPDFQQMISQNITEAELDQALQLLGTTDSFSYTQNKAEFYFERAQECLDRVGVGPSQKVKITDLVESLRIRCR